MASEEIICGKFKSDFRVDVWDRYQIWDWENDAWGKNMKKFFSTNSERMRCGRFQA